MVTLFLYIRLLSSVCPEQVSTRDFESENLATGQLRMISTGLAFILAPLENLARALDGVCVKSAFFAERDI